MSEISGRNNKHDLAQKNKINIANKTLMSASVMNGPKIGTTLDINIPRLS